MRALALISDLAVRSHAAAAAERTGATLSIVGSEEALLAQASQSQPELVILDLSHPGLDASALVPRLRAVVPAGVQLLAFGPHVHGKRLAAASAAGCHRVISRGEFHARCDAILALHSGQP